MAAAAWSIRTRREGGGGHQERGHGDPRSQHRDDSADLIEFGEFNDAFLPRCRPPRRLARRRSRRSPSYAASEVQGYQMTATKDNVPKIWGELK